MLHLPGVDELRCYTAKSRYSIICTHTWMVSWMRTRSMESEFQKEQYFTFVSISIQMYMVVHVTIMNAVQNTNPHISTIKIQLSNVYSGSH